MRYLVGEEMTGGYGDADILHDCTIGVDEGEIAVVVGPNGAGKSTAMKAVFGMLALRSGRVLMNGERSVALCDSLRMIIFFLNVLQSFIQIWCESTDTQ